MFFLMKCSHHPEMNEQRDKHRVTHREWVKSGGNELVVVLIGSATLDDMGNTMGNFGILQCKSLNDALAFSEGDPFNIAGIVSRIKMTRLTDGFQANRISNPMTQASIE